MAEGWRGKIGAMEPDRRDLYLEGGAIVRISAINDEGFPHVVPAWYHWDGTAFWFVLRARAEIAKILARNPHVGLVIDEGSVKDEANGRFFEMPKVWAQGMAEVIEEPNIGGRWVEIASKMAVRYLGPNGPEYITASINQAAMAVPGRAHGPEDVGGHRLGQEVLGGERHEPLVRGGARAQPIHRLITSMPVQQLFDLSGRVALVTGGARGLGVVMATALAEAGARVVITSTKQADITARAAEIAADTGREIIGVAGDVALEGDCERVVTEVEQAFGRLDILVNNAGINLRGAIDELTVNDFERSFAVNVNGTWLMCRAARRLPRARRRRA